MATPESVPDTREVVAVIGGGPAGLAAAATLKPLGLDVRVLEKSNSVGSRWRGHYDRLHLHTTRGMSALPGLSIPKEYGRWVSRDDFASYQEAYANHHGIPLELGTTVERIDRVADHWRVTTSKGVIDARYVVVGAGFNNTSYLPTWPGRESFAGTFLHSKDYKTGATFAGKKVLVVGTGNSGAEIATDLGEHGAQVWWSFRTPPTILPRATLGIATQGFGVMLRPMSPKIVDAIMAGFGKITIGSLAKYGLPKATRGGYTAALRDHVIPVLDVGLVRQIREGHVTPVPTISAFHGAEVELADGQRITPDVVVACTGFRTALEPMIGHLGVLDEDGIPTVSGGDVHPNAPNMHFLGYTNAISGNLREIASHAKKLAKTIAGELRTRT